MVSTEDPVSKTELVGKTTIKAQLGDEIKKLSIHNDDLTYDELIIMLQRLFKNHITKDDELTLKYKDEDGDLITLNDNLDLNTALEASLILKITVFVHGKEFCLETSEVKKIRHELQGIRDRVNHLLDCLEYRKDEDSVDIGLAKHNLVVGKGMSLDKSGKAFNGPSTFQQPKFDVSDKPGSNLNLSSSKEFDPYLRKDREEIEGRTDESEVILGVSRAPPTGSSVINNLLRPAAPASYQNDGLSQAGAAHSMAKDSKPDQGKGLGENVNKPAQPPTFAMMNGGNLGGVHGKSDAEHRQSPSSWLPKQAEGIMGSAPPQILPTVQHAHLPPPFNPAQHQSFGPVSSAPSSQFQPQYQQVFQPNRQASPGPATQFGLPQTSMIGQGPPAFGAQKQQPGQAVPSYPPLAGGPQARPQGPPSSMGYGQPPQPQSSQPGPFGSAMMGNPQTYPPPPSSTEPPRFKGEASSVSGPPMMQSQFQTMPLAPPSQPSHHYANGPPTMGSMSGMPGAPPQNYNPGPPSGPAMSMGFPSGPTSASGPIGGMKGPTPPTQFYQGGPPPASAPNPAAHDPAYNPGAPPPMPQSSNGLNPPTSNPYARMPAPPGGHSYYQQSPPVNSMGGGGMGR